RSRRRRCPSRTKPGLRGVLAMGQAVWIGVRALTVSANQSVEDEDRLTPKQMGWSMVFAFTLFAAVFVVGPFLAFRLLRHQVASSVLRNALEGVGRVALFVGYIALIGRLQEIRRVFQYHGAEHKTIAAYEDGAPLEPTSVDQYSTLHVRCGTNFLLIVMILTVFVYTFFSVHGLWWGILLRLVTIPVIAATSYEIRRPGGRHPTSPAIAVSSGAGLWLQKVTTRPPDREQIQVAI